MIANYGFNDGSGDFFITIDTDRCDGCRECVSVCPAQVLEVGEDPIDPLREEPVAFVADSMRKKIKFSCAQCKPVTDRPPLPCMVACPHEAIT
ncbi:MAG: 4Fe-4S binding protein, partial [Pseudomonadota bacterium]